MAGPRNPALRAAVEARIRRAFAGVTLGDGISLKQAAVIDNFGEGFTDSEFERIPSTEVTSDWERVPQSDLELGDIPHLDPAGFRYYIPRFMLSVLADYRPGEMRAIATLSALRARAEDWLRYYAPRYEILSFAQCRAIACYLDALPHVVDLDTEDEVIVERAMRHWRRFLPILE